MKSRLKNAIFHLVCASASTAIHAAAVGIIGGTNSNIPVVELLTDLNGGLLPVSIPVDPLQISNVSINERGLSLIGGLASPDAYVAFVQPDGAITPLSLSLSNSGVGGLAINNSGLGLLALQGGSQDDHFVFVTEEGVGFFQAEEIVRDVALNDAGLGLVYGTTLIDPLPFVYYVTADGSVSSVDLSGMPMGTTLSSVAINQSGNGIVSTTGAPYSAFVYPNLTSLAISPSPEHGHSVAINNSGIGLIGGQDAGNAFAGLVAPNGVLTPLISSPFVGRISSVAINDSGMGLMGGLDGSNVYAALIRPDGSLLPLFSASQAGEIRSVAINEAGVGLVGGQMSGTGYAALVAPNGTLTPLVFTATNVRSVDLVKGEVINQVVPTSIAPYSSVFYSHLAVMRVLNNRFSVENRVWAKNENVSKQGDAQEKIVFNRLQANLSLAQEGMDINPALAFSPEVEALPKQPEKGVERNSFWIQPFGDLIYSKAQGSIPKYNNQIAGGLVGYERQRESYIVGACAGYVFNYVDASHGHAKIQEEIFSLYGSYYAKHFWMALAVCAGPYQATNKRHFLGMTAKGKMHGWILDPHLELASPWALGSSERYHIEPFARIDWVNNWQHAYTEKGASGFNVHVPSIYNSLLQSEIGLRFYEQFLYAWGKICLEESLSYVNQAPYGTHKKDVAFVSSAAFFPVALANSRTQNLGAAELLVCFVPKNPVRPYGGFSFQAMAGSSFQSYFGSVFVGIDF